MTASAMVFAFLLWQGADCRSCDVLADMATSLSANEGWRFMERIDKSTPGYEDLALKVNALTAQDDIVCSLDVLQEDGAADRIEALVDWYMDLTTRNDASPQERRRRRVKVVLRKFGKDWRVVEIDPLSILDPMRIQKN